jgi:hypothetical protein
MESRRMIEDKIREIEEQAKRMIEEGHRLSSLKETLEALALCSEKGIHNWELSHIENEHQHILGEKHYLSMLYGVTLMCSVCGSRVSLKDENGAEVYYAIGNKVSDLLEEDEDDKQKE